MAEHIVGPKTYITVFVALEILTVATAAVARIPLGPFNTVVALTIATTKALIVMLFFMHLKFSTKLTGLVVALGFLWLAIMLSLTMSDYLTRHLESYPRM
jgi:cytochrome c oxidase subunit 4